MIKQFFTLFHNIMSLVITPIEYTITASINNTLADIKIIIIPSIIKKICTVFRVIIIGQRSNQPDHEFDPLIPLQKCFLNVSFFEILFHHVQKLSLLR